MKTLISISFLLLGCASAPKGSKCEPAPLSPLVKVFYFGYDTEFNKCIASENIEREKDIPEKLATQEASAQRERMKIEIKHEGAPMDEFVKYWGEPLTTELVEGNKRLWYGNEVDPFYVTFKDGKLFSLTSDKETVEERRDNFRRTYQAKENSRLERRSAVLNYQPIPLKSDSTDTRIDQLNSRVNHIQHTQDELTKTPVRVITPGN
jgi:hypothetical protein